MLRKKLSTCLMGAAVAIAAPNGVAAANPLPPLRIQSTASGRLQDRVPCSERGDRNVWRYGEPDIGDVLDDPIVQSLMKRDGVTRAFLMDLLKTAMDRNVQSS